MFLFEAGHIIWVDIISEVKSIWEHMKLVVEQRGAVMNIKFFILSPINEDAKIARIAEKNH